MSEGDNLLVKTTRLEERLLALEKATQVAIETQEKSVKAAFLASENALSKVEVFSEKRFDSHNQFRQQLEAQASTFLTIKEFQQAVIGIDQKMLGTEDKIGLLSSRIDKNEGNITGKSKGITEFWGILVTVITIGIGFVSISATILFFFLKK